MRLPLHVPQSGPSDCGVAAVLMIQAVLGAPLSFQLVEQVDSQGIDLRTIAIHLNGQSYAIEDPRAWNRLKSYPVLVRCQYPQPHYLVVWKRWGRWFHVSNPSRSSPEWVSWNEFHRNQPTHLVIQNLPPRRNGIVRRMLLWGLMDLVTYGVLLTVGQGSHELRLYGVLLASLLLQMMIIQFERHASQIESEEWMTMELSQYRSEARLDIVQKMFHVKIARLYERTKRIPQIAQIIALSILVLLVDSRLFMLYILIFAGGALLTIRSMVVFPARRLIEATHRFEQSLHEKTLVHSKQHYRALIRQVKWHQQRRALYMIGSFISVIGSYLVIQVLDYGMDYAIIESLNPATLTLTIGYCWLISKWYEGWNIIPGLSEKSINMI